MRIKGIQTHMRLVCADCNEVRELWTGDDGHSLIAVNAIADEFDEVHDECEKAARVLAEGRAAQQRLRRRFR
jgi:hypothetical protein